jgi:hypothetical protein
VQRRKSQDKAKKLLGGLTGGGGAGERDGGRSPTSPDNYSPVNANVLHLDLSRGDLFAQYEIMLERLEHDMIQAVECRLQSTMIDAMEATIQEMVLIPAMDILQERKSKKKYKDMNFFINMYCVGERMIRDLVKTFTHVMMRKMTNEFKQLILKWRVQIYAMEDIRGLIASNAVVVSVDERLHR